jgi:Leucine-rich repeat (LRR) protein
MNVLKEEINELKQMQKFPRFHLSNYFDKLKNEIDLRYAFKQVAKDIYLEIIKIIELFEQDAYKTCKSINTFDNEIKSIEDKLSVLNLIEISKLIDELKYKIEREIFSNKSIFFYEKDRDYDNDVDDDKQQKKYSFLIIINDKYIRKRCIDYDSLKILTKEKLNAWILTEIIKKPTIKKRIVLNLNYTYRGNIEVNNQEIEVIHENTLNGFINLKKISFSQNLIKEINPNLFNRLVNLEKISFRMNKIEVINEYTFNGLTNLKEIDFSSNQIKKMHPNMFKGLVKLENIDFSFNKIEAIHENTFNDLTNLRNINFQSNKIKEIHPNLFNGLINLEYIDFTENNIEIIHENIYLI